MKIAVLLKRVPDLVEELEVDDSGRALDPDSVSLKLNEFDDHALEEALLLKEQGDSGGEVVVIALDGENVDRVLHTALAKGADSAIKITATGEIEGNLALARLFVEVLRSESSESYDLVLTGVQAADDLDGQLAPMVAALLDLPSVEVVTGVAPAEGAITPHKEVSGGVVAELEVTLPAVLGIQAARSTPRYAPISKVRQMQQGATLETVAAGSGEGSGVSVVVMTPPETGEGAQMLAGIDELYQVLESKGVIR